MSNGEYSAAGLDKLSTEELEALNQWLITYTAQDAAIMRSGNEEVKEAADNVLIQARVLPPFTGWSGETSFHLDNGQVWRQRIKGRFTYAGNDTTVEIKKNILGFYKMKHLASGNTVGVSREK